MDEKRRIELDNLLIKKYSQLERQKKVGTMGNFNPGDIPVLYATGRGLAEAWENSTIALWNEGIDIRTQYDQKNSDGEYISPPSKDCTMSMVITEPNSEPKIHKCFPGGYNNLEEYRQEVVDGIKNHWVRDPNNPDDNRWEYTYNERLENYTVPGLEEAINQFEEMAQKLAQNYITRRANMITWKPWEDNTISDPPCLQSLWGRIFRNEQGNPKLNLNIRFRSRDDYKAAFMNAFGFIDYGNKLADRISELSGEEVSLGRFVDQSDSFHIYGKDFIDFYNVFANSLEKRTFFSEDDLNSRACCSDSPEIKYFFDMAKKEVPKKIAKYDKEKAERKEKGVI